MPKNLNEIVRSWIRLQVPQHRVAMATFWRIFHQDGKSSPAWWGWGVHALPLSLYLPSRTKMWCTLQLRGKIHVHSPYFYSTPICSLWERSPQDTDTARGQRFFAVGLYTLSHLFVLNVSMSCRGWIELRLRQEYVYVGGPIPQYGYFLAIINPWVKIIVPTPAVILLI